MDFAGNTKIVLRAGTGKYPLALQFAAASAPTANDGSLPYGTTIAAVTVIVTDPAGTNITTAAVESAVVAAGGLQVDLQLNYPAAAAKGQCVTMLLLTLSSTATLVKRWDGLKIE